MSWQFDAPLGVYRDNTLSNKVRWEAIEQTQFMKFLRPEPGFGANKGQSVTIVRFQQLPIAGRVGELDKLPSGRPAISTKSITVVPWGFKCPISQFEEKVAPVNVPDQIMKGLRDQMSKTLDKMGADAMKATPVKFTPQAAGGLFSTTGTPGGLADKNLSVSDLRQIKDYLVKTLKAPAFANGNWVGILSTRAARGLKNDPEYKDWNAPSSPSAFVSGQLKTIESIDLYESNHFNAVADLVGTSTVCGEAVFFGDDPAVMAVVENPEIRAGIPQELGTQRDIGWVGIMEAALTWEQASLTRVVHVSST